MNENLLGQPKCKICRDKKPEIYSKWLIGIREEDEDLGHTYIKRTGSQKRELYQMYVDSFPLFPCPACQQPSAEEDFKKRLQKCENRLASLEKEIASVRWRLGILGENE